MAKRLHKTTADYLAIAVSPALIMALVGSIVYFLIAVMYVGEYSARLNYSFGLFVFLMRTPPASTRHTPPRVILVTWPSWL